MLVSARNRLSNVAAMRTAFGANSADDLRA